MILIEIPYWAKKLNKKQLFARQLSKRGGALFCKDQGDRVIISRQVKTYAIGSFEIA